MSTYRVGNHQPQNVYRDQEYIGVMFTPEDAALVVQTLNGDQPVTPEPCGCPAERKPVRWVTHTRECSQRRGVEAFNATLKFEDHPHPTCADISTADEPPGTAWICTSACRTTPEAQP